MEQQKEQLQRSIGVFGLSANIINIIIGSGIFVLPAIVAAGMGASSIFAYLFCGLLLALIMLCFAEVGSKITNTGGTYTYIETAFGDYAGFLTGNFFVVAAILSDAAVSNALVDILAIAFPVFEKEGIRLLFLFLVFFGFAFINVIGVKQGIGVVKFFVIAKLLPLVLLIIFGWSEVSGTNLAIESFPGFKQLGETSLILFFAFVGAESAVVVGGEVKNPSKTFPRAIFIGISVVLIVYILVQMVSQGVLGAQLPNFPDAPLAETARVVFGQYGFLLLTIGAGISMVGFLSGDILNAPRALYALSRDRVIPTGFFARIHKSFKTPHLAIIAYSLVGFFIAALSSFEQLAVISTSAILLQYLGVVFALIKLRRTQKSKPDEYKVPGGLIIPIISIGIILFFLSHLSYAEMIGTLIFIAVLTLVFFISKSLKKRRGKH